jgi:hypothetical protein
VFAISLSIKKNHMFYYFFRGWSTIMTCASLYFYINDVIIGGDLVLFTLYVIIIFFAKMYFKKKTLI